MNAAILLGAALALSACIDASDETTTAADVFAIKVDCPTASPCQLADGGTPIRVRLCLTSHRPHAATVPATVRTSTGHWLTVDADQQTAATIDLAGTQCEAIDTDATYRDLSLVPGRDPGPARVEATVAPFTASVDLSLASAPFGDVELRPAALDLGAARAIALTATVHTTVGGPPSTGTWVDFVADQPLPAGALAVIVPARVEVTADGIATATLQTSAGITSVHLTATANGRAIDGLAPPPFPRELTLTDLP